MADPADAALSQPARRSRDGAGVWQGISGRHLSRSAAGILGRRYRVPRRRQPHVRRLSAGAAMRGRDVLGLLSPRARHRRRPAGGARGAALHDDRGLQFARRRIRSNGAGPPALGAAAPAYLANDRAEPAQRVVRMVDRGRPVAADDLGCDRAVAVHRRICGCDVARPAHADVARSALCAAGDRRPGAALC